MAKKVLAQLMGEAIQSSTDYEAAPGGYLVTLGYKEMKDKAGKSKGKPPANFIACIPALALPSTSNAALDTILKAAMEGYAESLVRKLRTEEGEADSIEFSQDDFSLQAIIEHAEEKASSLKLSEVIIGAWWKAEGHDACMAQYIVERNIDTNDSTQMLAVQTAVANIALLFLKLSAPTPDILPELCEVMLRRLSVLEEPSSTTQAIRRKLQKRIEDAAKARSLLSEVGAV